MSQIILQITINKKKYANFNTQNNAYYNHSKIFRVNHKVFNDQPRKQLYINYTYLCIL